MTLRRIEVLRPDDVGHVRREAIREAERLGLDAGDQGRVAIVATEAASNIIKHARGGELLLGRALNGGATLNLLAVDRGPGIADIGNAMRDGASSTGTRGTGLGAIRRLSDRFDLFSAPGRGVALLAQFQLPGRPARAADFLFGGVSLPAQGEELCGDGWASFADDARATLLVSDGLGHGPDAHRASREAIAAFTERRAEGPAHIVESVNGRLRSTRGAAAAVVEIARGPGTVRFCGIGNLSACLIESGTLRHLVSHYGTLGHDVRKVQEFQYPWTRDSVLLVHTDGIHTHWDLEPYPGLLARHPLVIAAIVTRDFSRGRDDTTVVVARETR